MTMAHPAALWLLPVLVLSAALAFHRGQVRWQRVRWALGAGDGPGLGALQRGTLLFAASFLGLGLVGLRLGGNDTSASGSGPVSGVSVVLAVDVSQSMAVRDVVPDRMTRARMAAFRIASGFSGRMGLVGFAAEGHLLLPPTEDRGLLALYLDALGPEITSARGSDLASAVGAALSAVGGDSTRARHVVVLSDGEGFEDPADMARITALAQAMGVHVHGLVVGTGDGGAVPGIPGSHSAADMGKLQALASRTGGLALREGDGGAARLAGVLASRPVPPQPVDVHGPAVDVTGVLAVLALLALAMESLTAGLRRRLTF